MNWLTMAALIIHSAQDKIPIKPGYKWRTINHAKVLLNGSDKVIAGAGGKFKGKKWGAKWKLKKPAAAGLKAAAATISEPTTTTPAAAAGLKSAAATTPAATKPAGLKAAAATISKPDMPTKFTIPDSKGMHMLLNALVPDLKQVVSDPKVIPEEIPEFITFVFYEAWVKNNNVAMLNILKASLSSMSWEDAIQVLKKLGISVPTVEEYKNFLGDLSPSLKKALENTDNTKPNATAFNLVKPKLASKSSSMVNSTNSTKPNPSTKLVQQPEAKSNYSMERKEKAQWAMTHKAAIDGLFDKCKEVWGKMTKDEREFAFEYTYSYSQYNEPLRGIEYGTSKFKGVGNIDFDTIGINYKGCKKGEVKKKINALTSAIDKSYYDHDVFLRRGVDWSGTAKLLGVSEADLKGDIEKIKSKLLNREATEYGFASCGSTAETGFKKNVDLHIFAPKGTRMLYAEPWSAYGKMHSGNKDVLEWNGNKKPTTGGSEHETILQRGTKFKVVGVSQYKSGKLRLDVEIIGQDPYKI